ncbi:RidA family protein [Congregibacter sp.]|nr:RidA family protein [Congregibacter sp.]MDA8962280.1 RidA family protein [Congregibacter sp.]
MIRLPIVLSLLGAMFAFGSLSVLAQEITRNKTPGSDFPIAQSVQVPGASELIFVSGAVPKPIVEGGDPDHPATYGDTEAQTVSVLKEVQSRLQRLGLDMGDVVMMRAYLVGTPQTDNRMDFAGFMRGYTQFFGTEEQPHLPSRSAFQIAGLARAGWFVEIEVVAARAP